MARIRLALSYAFGFGASLALAVVFPVAIATQLGRAETGRVQRTPGSRAGRPANRPPSVTAGRNVRIVLGKPVSLEGTISDDGLPDRRRPVAAAWIQVRGPRSAAFADPAAADTRATFPLPGLYALRLTADDGDLFAIDDMTVEVADRVRPAKRQRTAAAWGDDLEPSARVRVRRDSLELVGEGGSRMMGLRFTGMAIPRNAKVLSAHVQFEAGEEDTWAGSLTIRGQRVDDAPGFTKATAAASLRPLTVAGVDWAPFAGTSTGGGGGGRRTPDLSAVVQEIVCRPGWTPGNALVLVFTGTGRAKEEPIEGERMEEPLLQIEYRQRPGA